MPNTSAILKIYFAPLLLNWKAKGSIQVTCKSKLAKNVWSKTKAGSHLENLFQNSSSEPYGQLTRNFIRSIGLTCRSKIAKIILTGWPVDSKLPWEYRGDLFKLLAWGKKMCAPQGSLIGWKIQGIFSRAMFNTLWANSADNRFFLFFPQKTGFDIPCKLSRVFWK